jgi:hypothetical protein
LAKDPRHKKYFAVYNNDRRYYTPAFVIGKDLREYTTIPYYDLEKFKDKLGDA